MGKPKQVTREDLVFSARRQLLQKGRMKVTLKNVAEAAGVTQGVVYYHFRSKEQLLISLLHDFIRSYAEPADGLEDMDYSTEAKGRMRMFLGEELYKSQTGSDAHRLLLELASIALHHREMKDMLGRAMARRAGSIAELAGGDQALGRLIAAAADGIALHSIFDPSFDEAESYGLIRKLIEMSGKTEE